MILAKKSNLFLEII